MWVEVGVLSGTAAAVAGARGRRRLTTAMPMRNSAEGTTTQSSSQNSVTPQGRPTDQGLVARTLPPYRSDTV